MLAEKKYQETSVRFSSREVISEKMQSFFLFHSFIPFLVFITIRLLLQRTRTAEIKAIYLFITVVADFLLSEEGIKWQALVFHLLISDGV